MEQAMGPGMAAEPPSVDEPPTLASELRSSALLFALIGVIVAAALLVTKAVGALTA